MIFLANLLFLHFGASIDFGTLHVIEADSPDTPKGLQVVGGYLVSSRKLSVFDYHALGGLEQFNSQKYLFVNLKGEIILVSGPRKGFEVSESIDTRGIREVSYKGFRDFQLCANGKINFNSECVGARTVKIAYKDLSFTDSDDETSDLSGTDTFSHLLGEDSDEAWCCFVDLPPDFIEKR